jgi:hypothetical protein
MYHRFIIVLVALLLHYGVANYDQDQNGIRISLTSDYG